MKRNNVKRTHFKNKHVHRSLKLTLTSELLQQTFHFQLCFSFLVPGFITIYHIKILLYPQISAKDPLFFFKTCTHTLHFMMAQDDICDDIWEQYNVLHMTVRVTITHSYFIYFRRVITGFTKLKLREMPK